jgi:hypothetical protein
MNITKKKHLIHLNSCTSVTSLATPYRAIGLDNRISFSNSTFSKNYNLSRPFFVSDIYPMTSRALSKKEN